MDNDIIDLNLECLLDSHCISTKACRDQKCIDPCDSIDCSNYSDGKWCKTRNHEPHCTGKNHTTVYLLFNLSIF